VVAGSKVVLGMTANGSPPPTFVLFKDGVKLADGETYTIEAAFAAHAGVYTARATNSEGTATSDTYTLQVEPAPPPPPPPPRGPVFTLHPASQEVPANLDATFTVTATGTAPIAFQWFNNGTVLPGATRSSYVAGPLHTGNETFHAAATNVDGTAMSNQAVLWRSAAAPLPPVLPAFTLHPVGVTVAAGFSLNLTVAVTGFPVPTLQWAKDGAAIAGATAANYVTIATTAAIAGSYTATARNTAGAVTSNAAIVIFHQPQPTGIAPTIVIAPANSTVPKKGTAQFKVVATGDAPLRYQWYRNNVALSGQTAATMTFTNINPSFGGVYVVTVWNAFGSVNATARLTVK
jgi:beta-galactosidase